MCTCGARLRKTGQKYKGRKKRGMDLSSFCPVSILIRGFSVLFQKMGIEDKITSGRLDYGIIQDKG